jgi:hypothetical protein
MSDDSNANDANDTLEGHVGPAMKGHEVAALAIVFAHDVCLLRKSSDKEMTQAVDAVLVAFDKCGLREGKYNAGRIYVAVEQGLTGDREESARAVELARGMLHEQGGMLTQWCPWLAMFPEHLELGVGKLGVEQKLGKGEVSDMRFTRWMKLPGGPFSGRRGDAAEFVLRFMRYYKATMGNLEEAEKIRVLTDWVGNGRSWFNSYLEDWPGATLEFALGAMVSEFDNGEEYALVAEIDQAVQGEREGVDKFHARMRELKRKLALHSLSAEAEELVRFVGKLRHSKEVRMYGPRDIDEARKQARILEDAKGVDAPREMGAGGGTAAAAIEDKDKPCYLWEKDGKCRFGARCKYKHGVQQQQDRANAATVSAAGYPWPLDGHDEELFEEVDMEEFDRFNAY